MAFRKSDRQRIIDGYLTATGRNMFVPSEFVDWLSDQPDHEAYPWFFDKSDEEAAREYRVDLARRMASGLRIVAKVEDTRSDVISITTREYPAYLSPTGGRRNGGGYVRTDPRDFTVMDELRRQGATALRGWLNRYRGAAEDAGVDITPIEEIVAQLSGDVAEAG